MVNRSRPMWASRACEVLAPAVGRVRRMITGELRNKIDKLWDAFWAEGISNPLRV